MYIPNLAGLLTSALALTGLTVKGECSLLGSKGGKRERKRGEGGGRARGMGLEGSGGETNEVG